MSDAPTAGMCLTVREEGRVTVVAVSGEIDTATVGALRDAINAALAAGVTHLAVDMHEVTFIDSSGLGALISGYKRAERDGRALEVLDPSHVVERLLRLTGQLDRFVGVRATEVV